MEYSLIHIVTENYYSKEKEEVTTKIIGIFKDYNSAQKYIEDFGSKYNNYSYDITSIYSDI